jgi:hypothetical protein
MLLERLQMVALWLGIPALRLWLPLLQHLLSGALASLEAQWNQCMAVAHQQQQQQKWQQQQPQVQQQQVLLLLLLLWQLL